MSTPVDGYRIADDHIAVLRILHGHRDWHTIIDDEET